ncbi:DUF4232 domain-containing protein [Micromonospora peucetia]|uniref:DUF4232 domain-containing protein n=1 Tax=Micromonospora peucetia TaxID=47871 RepID=UPI00224F1BD2|nr:DUF4232 domain-containing protein [Micromonospora peucetia]MCX4389190.1 DUF4232 domain-containing protein [Micromonospora peucetia]
MAGPAHRPAPHVHNRFPGSARAVGLAVAGLVLLGACSPATDLPSAAPTPPAPTTPAAPTPANPAPDAPRPAAPPTAAASGTTPTTDCPKSGVRISSPGVSAAMGLRALSLELVNCGKKPYPLDGYPALRLLDGDGNPIPVQVIEGAKGITSGFDAPPRPLTLRPGERAGAAVLWRNLVTDSTVVATNGEGLEVAAATGQPAQAVETNGPIDLGNTGRLGVSAWKKQSP